MLEISFQDSFDSFEDDESEMAQMQQQMGGLRIGGGSGGIGVPANGLGGSNGSVNSDRGGGGGGGGGGGLRRRGLNAEEEDELPKSVIVTNVDLSVFDTQDGKVS